MKIIVANDLKVIDPPFDIHNYITQHFHGPHPEYIKAKMDGVPYSGPKIRKMYQVGSNGFILPRGAFKKLRRILPTDFPYTDRRISNPIAVIPIRVPPRDYQIPVYKSMASAQQGYILAPCGAGKTNIFIYLIAAIRQKTLVIVHRKTLMNQFVKRFKLVTGKTAGRFYSDEKTICDVTVGINKSVKTHLIGTPEWDQFGCIIVDECDITPTNTMIPILHASKAKYRFGGTATYKRFDQQHYVLDFLIGHRIADIAQKEIKQSVLTPQVVFVKTPYCPSRHPGWHMNNTTGAWEKSHGKVLMRKVAIGQYVYKQLTQNPARQLQIANMTRELYKQGHVVLLIFKQKVDCKYMRAMLTSMGLHAELMTSDTKESQRQDIIDSVNKRETRILIGIDVVSRGLDIPCIDRIIVTVRRDLTQVIGRGQRPAPGKKDIVVYQLVDNHPAIIDSFKGKRYKLQKAYKIVIGEAFIENLVG